MKDTAHKMRCQMYIMYHIASGINFSVCGIKNKVCWMKYKVCEKSYRTFRMKCIAYGINYVDSLQNERYKVINEA